MNNSFKIYKLVFFVIFIFFASNAFSQRLSEVEKYDTSLMNIHSPLKASLYSAVLPGLGQIYNKKYWKLPIIYGGAGALIYYINFNQTRYLKYKSLYIKKVANDPSDMPRLAAIATEDQLISQIEMWSENRDYLILGLAALYIANILDATVDAYLFDYEVSQDLSMKIKPVLINSPESYNFGLSLAFYFK
jgi:hypothetical protein